MNDVIFVIRDPQRHAHKFLSNWQVHAKLLLLFYLSYFHSHPILLLFQVRIIGLERLKMLHNICMAFKIFVTKTANKRSFVILNHLQKLLFLWERLWCSNISYLFLLFLCFYSTLRRYIPKGFACLFWLKWTKLCDWLDLTGQLLLLWHFLLFYKRSMTSVSLDFLNWTLFFEHYFTILFEMVRSQRMISWTTMVMQNMGIKHIRSPLKRNSTLPTVIAFMSDKIFNDTKLIEILID